MIRKAQRSDIGQIKEVGDLCFEKPRSIAWYEKFLCCDFFVYVEDAITGLEQREIIGFVILEIDTIVLLAVHPDHRGEGIASELLEALPARYLKLRVRAPNEEAREFYLSEGWIVSKIIPKYYKNGDDAIEMEKTSPSS